MWKNLELIKLENKQVKKKNLVFFLLFWDEVFIVPMESRGGGKHHLRKSAQFLH